MSSQIPILVDDRQAQTLLCASRSTLYRLRRAGLLRCVNIGGALRYHLSDIEKMASNGASSRSLQSAARPSIAALDA
jgi:predicted site-specific integrase-resolvase